MADPICRWRNSSLKQLNEFNLLFPLKPISKTEGRAIVAHNWSLLGGSDFFTTPYQLAAQMGIYYEDDSIMYPRFDRYIDLDCCNKYMQNWGRNYYAPNPYTKSMRQTHKPVVINKYLVNWITEKGEGLFFTDALEEMFAESIGNTDILINMINSFMDVEIIEGKLFFKKQFIARKYPQEEVFLEVDPNDKKTFFDYFGQIDYLQERNNKDNSDSPLQEIFYGAPGTGKSHAIKVITEKAEKEGRVVRTTFHPDSDYSTFVGAYKPTMSTSSRNHRLNLSMEDLAQKLGIMYNDEKLGKIGGLQKFCYDYFPYISGEFMSVNVTKLLELAGVPSSYNVEVNKYINFCGLLPKPADDKIVYTFVPQAFTNAYVKAWNTTENVYLIIEEINRGNCAQIFGDLFQLLDRNEKGESDYHVDADTDLGNYIASELESSVRDDFPDGVKEGKKLVLPSNLYIWATMNTSDQSLFPIDSAFKRRWDWKYMPIENEEKGWKIVVNEHEYDWYKFLKAINDEVLTLTHSEDKQLGYFFAKAKDGIIDAETLVNKVYFYLWTDVFKDYDYESQKAFLKPDGKGAIAFKDFFEKGEVVEEMAEQVLINLELNEKDEPEG